ncbi:MULTISPECIES: hypothetical protein [unclassified Ruegeria]|uniref:hypothetical protein n=1 Tax=unclassified Ruegeria TaxID=2625375 RepID=UPI001FFE0BBA|nr:MULTISPECIES: hypothetical protein [unclassified Ruegeria]
MFLLGASCIWAPISGYLATAPVKYTSHASLILPGSGASASVNLANIGQASSYANSAFANGSISPTETYKRLLSADRILDAAAKAVEADREAFGKPRVQLVDQTSLVHIELKATSPADAQQYGDALVAAFFAEIDALRADELATREASSIGAIEDYTRAIQATRAEIKQLQVQSSLISVAQYQEQVAANDRAKQELRMQESELARQSEHVAALKVALDLPSHAAAATLKLYADAQYLSLLEDVSVGAAKLAQADATYGSNHPIHVKAQNDYEGARSGALERASQVTGLTTEQLGGLDRAPEGQRAQLLSELVREDALRAGLEEHVATLRKQIRLETLRLSDLAPIAAELEDRQRDFAVAEAVFASAIARSESKKTDVYASYPLIQVLENPSLPTRPSSPNKKVSIAAGIAASLMLLMGLALAWIRNPLIAKLLKDQTEAAV